MLRLEWEPDWSPVGHLIRHMFYVEIQKQIGHNRQVFSKKLCKIPCKAATEGVSTILSASLTNVCCKNSQTMSLFFMKFRFNAGLNPTERFVMRFKASFCTIHLMTFNVFNVIDV